MYPLTIHVNSKYGGFRDSSLLKTPQRMPGCISIKTNIELHVISAPYDV